MNEKEIGEIRRRVRRDRSNMAAIFGCYVNDKKEIVAQFRQPTGIMSENEADRYFGLMKRVLSGTVGKNLIDVSFRTSQVAGSPEHKLLMDLRESAFKDDALREEFSRAGACSSGSQISVPPPSRFFGYFLIDISKYPAGGTGSIHLLTGKIKPYQRTANGRPYKFY